RFPAGFGPSEMGATADTYASTYFQNRGANLSGLMVGGLWFSGENCSPVFFHSCFANGGIAISGRLFVLPA
ncbi:MAG: hypothetical protein RR336_08670, partial [Oscillospiraceae bacterium]